MRALAIVVLVAMAATAHAEPSREARAHFEAGQRHHKLGRFAEAIDEYQRAYELAPLPDLLFNIGQCYRNLKNWERAIFFFDRYLEEAPDSRDAELVRSLIAELEETIARETPPPTSTATLAEVLPPPPPPPIVVPPPVEPEPAVYQRWWFWTLIGVAVVGAAAGGTVAATRTKTPQGDIGTIDLR